MFLKLLQCVCWHTGISYAVTMQKTEQSALLKADASVEPCCMQAKLNWNHGNKMRTLRRQLQKKEAEVQALQLEFAKTKTNTAPIELDSAGQQAAFVSKEGKSHVEGDAPGPSNQGAKECACCKEKDDCVAKLEKELANAKAQCQQRKGVEQRASAEYADLMEEHKKLKIRVYDLRVSGC